jgi:threonine dehydrogenase-like Zn-dependent dehydrogenase
MLDAKIQRPTDALVKITTTNICGSEHACMVVKAKG